MHRVVFSLVFFLCLFTPLGANSLNFENIKETHIGIVSNMFKTHFLHLFLIMLIKHIRFSFWKKIILFNL